MNTRRCDALRTGFPSRTSCALPRVARLKQLALVEEHDGRIRLTPLGTERCRDDPPITANSSD